MPMPNKGEKESEFVSRCISYLSHEGKYKDPDQQAAICHSKWKQSKAVEASDAQIEEIEKLLEQCRCRERKDG